MAKFTIQQLLDHLYNKRLPQVYREADLDTDMCLRRFLQAMIEGGFTEALSSVEGITDLTDPLKCPDEIFPYLFNSFGYTYSADIPINYQRKVLYNHGELYQKRGSIEYINVLARILTGFDCGLSIERVNGVRLLTVTIYVDSSVTSVESQQYVNVVKKFVSEGYIPFYLDVDTNIMVDVVSIPTADMYLGTAVGVEGEVNISPVDEVSLNGFSFSLSPTLENEPITKLEIMGYSRIVPRYVNKNIINPNTATLHTNITGISGSFPTFDLLTDYCYVPYGNKLYFKSYGEAFSRYKTYVFLFNNQKQFIGYTYSPDNLIQDTALTVNLTDLLKNGSCETDYYVRVGVVAVSTITDANLYSALSAWNEDVPYAEYSAGTRFKYDDEYSKDGEDLPVYAVNVYDSNGCIDVPYETRLSAGTTSSSTNNYDILTFSELDTSLDNYVSVRTDCTTGVEEKLYYINFMTELTSGDFNGNPIVTVLCTNKKGTLITVTAMHKLTVTKSANLLIQGYTFTIPQDFVGVSINYKIPYKNTSSSSAMNVGQFMLLECNEKTGEPYIDMPYQALERMDKLSGKLGSFKNKLNLGIDGFPLLSYNDVNGNAIVRDSFDMISGILTRRVGVTYDSAGNPVNTYALSVPKEYNLKLSDSLSSYYNSDIEENTTGAEYKNLKFSDLTTFQGKTYICLDNSIPKSRLTKTGGLNRHTYLSIATRIIK